jgi:hypothetical protein
MDNSRPVWENGHMSLEEFPVALNRFSPENFASLSLASVLWVIALVIFAFFAAYSLVYLYHWGKYGSSTPIFLGAVAVYFAGSFFLLSTMVFSLMNLS